MRLWLCQIIPPLAVLLCGKPFTALLNVFLIVWPWGSARVHAEEVVMNHLQDKRFQKLGTQVKEPRERAPKQLREPKEKTAPAPTVVNDPVVGQNGTRFRKRS
jgi:uncharacterized membrane protein YqaE (UPF0057 family)